MEIEVKDLVSWSGALLGIGFAAWAIMLKRSLAVLDRLESALNGILNRLTIAEMNILYIQKEFDRERSHERD